MRRNKGRYNKGYRKRHGYVAYLEGRKPSCHWCGHCFVGLGRNDPVERRTGRWPTVDHVVALAEGGEDTFSNTVLACNRCNAARNSSTQRTVNPKFLTGKNRRRRRALTQLYRMLDWLKQQKDTPTSSNGRTAVSGAANRGSSP